MIPWWTLPITMVGTAVMVFQWATDWWHRGLAEAVKRGDVTYMPTVRITKREYETLRKASRG